MTPIERLPVNVYFFYEGIMQKCNHNIITKGYAPREEGWRTCCICFYITWIPTSDTQYMKDGKYDEEKIKQSATKDGVPHFPIMPTNKTVFEVVN